MAKTTLFCIFIFISINIYAQDDTLEKTNKADDTLLDKPIIDLLKEKKENHKRSSFTYLKYSSTNLSFNKKFINTSDFTIGNRKIDKDIIYGLELDNKKKNKVYSSGGILAHIGYQPSFESYRIKPYFLFHFGILKVKDLEKNIQGSSYQSAFDIGFKLSQSGPFSFYTGYKDGKNFYNKTELGQGSFKELYFIFGLEF